MRAGRFLLDRGRGDRRGRCTGRHGSGGVFDVRWPLLLHLDCLGYLIRCRMGAGVELPHSDDGVAGLVVDPEVAYVPVEGAALMFFEPDTTLPYIPLFEESEGSLEL